MIKNGDVWVVQQKEPKVFKTRLLNSRSDDSMYTLECVGVDGCFGWDKDLVFDTEEEANLKLKEKQW